MMERLLDNWRERPASERIILALVGVMMICTLFYLLIADPLIERKHKEQRQLKTHERLLVQVDGLVKRFAAQTTQDPESAEGLVGVLDSSLRKTGLDMQGIQPGRNNDARLRLNNVAFEPLTQWLYDLEYTYKLSIEELKINQTKTPGLLSVSVRVKQGS